ncbi:MAG: exodeoxyribonuclease V subunit alpha [Opitutales bacterium]|nr:exodeoxyribonuclease V subunit alpha [Opitutales bacterium]
MNIETTEEITWELDALASAISSFFERKVKGEQGRELGMLTRELVLKAGVGTSHLIEDEAAGICKHWQALPAIGSEEGNLPLVKTKDGKLYLRRFFEYEKQVAQALKDRLSLPPVPASQALIDFFKTYLADQVDDQQALAVGVAIQKNLLLLTGGPGTGKTRTIVAMLASHLQANPDMNVALTAPTGKAAFRLKQSVLEAINRVKLEESICSKLVHSARSMTLHRLLEPKIGSVDFRRSKANPLPYDLIVVDEASMVDLPLMAKLCDAIQDDAKLILVGDSDQLAPVQGGAVFNGLVRSSKSNLFSKDELSLVNPFSHSGSEVVEDHALTGTVVSLSRVHRREGSPSAASLGDLCDAIRDGKVDNALAIARDGGKCIRFIENLDDPLIDLSIHRGFSILSSTQSPFDALISLRNFRILCAHNEGGYGVLKWNSRACDVLPSKQSGPQPIVVGVNDYALGLFNGDDGVIFGDRVHFHSEEGTRDIARSRLPQHKQGYATTIHRSQGSEFEETMIILPPAGSRLLTRELFYVAVSRAKKAITLVGDEKAFKTAIMQSESSRSGVIDMLLPRPKQK